MGVLRRLHNKLLCAKGYCMFDRVLFLWLLVFSTFAKANVNPEAIPPLIDSYIRLNLDFDNIKRTWSDYGYKIFQARTEKGIMELQS